MSTNEGSAATSPFDGSRDHRDIRTFYTSELEYLRAMRKRYACQWCGTSAMTCPSCQQTNDRIKELEGCKPEREWVYGC